jgi:hypothetical protein
MLRRPAKTESSAMSLSRKTQARAKTTAALIGWGALFWMTFWIAPYLYAFNHLVQWR